MENKANIEFYRKSLVTPIKANEFKYSNHFSDYHSQDCCEWVHAELESFDIYEKQIAELGTITEVSISGTPDMGFTVFLYNSETRVGIFVPCYNDQSGYYSDNLELTVTFDGQKEVHDITGLKKDI